MRTAFILLCFFPLLVGKTYAQSADSSQLIVQWIASTLTQYNDESNGDNNSLYKISADDPQIILVDDYDVPSLKPDKGTIYIGKLQSFTWDGFSRRGESYIILTLKAPNIEHLVSGEMFHKERDYNSVSIRLHDKDNIKERITNALIDYQRLNKLGGVMY